MGQLLFKRNQIKLLHKITACVQKSLKKIHCAWTSFFIKNCIQQTSCLKNYGVVPPSGRYRETWVNQYCKPWRQKRQEFFPPLAVVCWDFWSSTSWKNSGGHVYWCAFLWDLTVNQRALQNGTRCHRPLTTVCLISCPSRGAAAAGSPSTVPPWSCPPLLCTVVLHGF